MLNDNTYFLVSLPTLRDFAPGDALLYTLADEVGLCPSLDDLKQSSQETNGLEPQKNISMC